MLCGRLYFIIAERVTMHNESVLCVQVDRRRSPWTTSLCVRLVCLSRYVWVCSNYVFGAAVKLGAFGCFKYTINVYKSDWNIFCGGFPLSVVKATMVIFFVCKNAPTCYKAQSVLPFPVNLYNESIAQSGSPATDTPTSSCSGSMSKRCAMRFTPQSGSYLSIN